VPLMAFRVLLPSPSLGEVVTTSSNHERRRLRRRREADAVRGRRLYYKKMIGLSAQIAYLARLRKPAKTSIFPVVA